MALPPDSSFFHENFTHIRGNEGGDARGDATVLNVLRITNATFKIDLQCRNLQKWFEDGMKYEDHIYVTFPTGYCQLGDHICAGIYGFK